MVVEGEAQLEQQPALEHPRRDARVTDGAEQDRVVTPELLEDAVRQRLTGLPPAAGTEVVVGRLHGKTFAGGHRAQDLQSFGDDLDADPVTRDDREPDRVTHQPRLEPVSGLGR